MAIVVAPEAAADCAEAMVALAVAWEDSVAMAVDVEDAMVVATMADRGVRVHGVVWAAAERLVDLEEAEAHQAGEGLAGDPVRTRTSTESTASRKRCQGRGSSTCPSVLERR